MAALPFRAFLRSLAGERNFMLQYYYYIGTGGAGLDERAKRINELAQKSRTVGLTEEEKAEQQRLRQE